MTSICNVLQIFKLWLWKVKAACLKRKYMDFWFPMSLSSCSETADVIVSVPSWMCPWLNNKIQLAMHKLSNESHYTMCFISYQIYGHKNKTHQGNPNNVKLPATLSHDSTWWQIWWGRALDLSIWHLLYIPTIMVSNKETFWVELRRNMSYNIMMHHLCTICLTNKSETNKHMCPLVPDMRLSNCLKLKKCEFRPIWSSSKWIYYQATMWQDSNNHEVSRFFASKHQVI